MTIQKKFLSRIGLAASALSLGACTVMPTGPTTLVMPGRNATMDSFRFDDSECRQYAYYQIGGVTPQDAANQSAVGSAVVGTAIGALAGAAIAADRAPRRAASPASRSPSAATTATTRRCAPPGAICTKPDLAAWSRSTAAICWKRSR